MAVYVLLAFDKDQDAKDFVENAINGYVATIAQGAAHDDPKQHDAEVRGIWQKPTMFCDDGDGHRGKKTEAGWTRGRKYGWWVCGKCGKPSERWAHGEQWDTTLGTNLLPAELFPQEIVRPEFRKPSPVEWSWLIPTSA